MQALALTSDRDYYTRAANEDCINGGPGTRTKYYYDADYRLDHSTLNGNLNLQMAYDTTGMGNIVSRSDVAGGAAWTYDPVRIHAVTQAGSSSNSYSYDANGNAITRNGYNVTWTSYNYLSGISSPGESVTFQYGPNRQRWQTIYTGSIGTETTYNVGNLLEKVENGGTTSYRHYIYAGSEPVAVYSRTSAGINTFNYILEDHQGSVTNIVTNSTPGPVSNYVSESFTAYGNRRSGETWSGPPTSGDESLINGVTRQGYTWQTALGVSMGLNHMNGRVEDAITGRFLSPDPHVPDPGSTQSYNRYSYVNNNPLSEIDPSGFFNLGDLLDPFSNSNPLNPFGNLGRKLLASPFTGISLGVQFGLRQVDSVLRDDTWLQPVAEVAACYWGGPYACAGGDAYLTRLNGGSIDQALVGGALTFASGYAYGAVDTGNWATDALATGAIGGTVSSLSGGSFTRGFEFAAGGSLIQSGYEYYVQHAPDWGSGQSYSTPNVDCADPSSNCYNFTADGHIPEEDWDKNTFGFNRELTGGSGDCWVQSGACSVFFDQVPGLQAVSQLHDTWMNVLPSSFNFLSMPFAAGLTYGALVGGSYYLVPMLSVGHH